MANKSTKSAIIIISAVILFHVTGIILSALQSAIQLDMSIVVIIGITWVSALHLAEVFRATSLIGSSLYATHYGHIDAFLVMYDAAPSVRPLQFIINVVLNWLPWLLLFGLIKKRPPRFML